MDLLRLCPVYFRTSKRTPNPICALLTRWNSPIQTRGDAFTEWSTLSEDSRALTLAALIAVMDGKEAGINFSREPNQSRQARPIKYRDDLIGLRDRIRILVSLRCLHSLQCTRQMMVYSAEPSWFKVSWWRTNGTVTLAERVSSERSACNEAFNSRSISE